ncbi:hypothetical protein Tco_0822054 [Tanacetum coccineum]|uniref:Uncharacterized protein n=1 Tax=Tanacetum coccineum TaxID=301880 RepID=A0ABQ5AE32_9ASTR
MEELRTKDMQVKHYLYQAIDRTTFEQILDRGSSKAIWDSLKKRYVGNDRVKKSMLQKLRRDFKVIEIKTNETIAGYFGRVLIVANQMRSNGETMSGTKIMEKILITLIEKYTLQTSGHTAGCLGGELLKRRVVTKQRVAYQRFAYQRFVYQRFEQDNGENIMKSIQEDHFKWETVSDLLWRTGGTEGAVQQGPVRARVLNDLSAEEKERYKADIRATNILLQGIPKDIYSLINHYTDAKDIWENVKMILEGSELTKDDRESQLYDEFEHFRQIKGETIQGYYVRFTKLINDMRNIKMTMSRMQLNSKFVNNMLPEWSRFITKFKLNRCLKESNYDQLYAYFKQHEVHANENRIMMERFIQPNNDPLALVSDASAQHSSTENLIESLSNSLALLTQSYKSHLPQTNNQLRASSNARNKAMVQDGKVVVQDVRGRYNANNQGRLFQRNNARGNGVAGNVGGQNRGGIINPGQAKPIKCYNCNGLGLCIFNRIFKSVTSSVF